MINNDSKHVIPEDMGTSDTIIYSESALGNGRYSNIRDIVYIKPTVFDHSKTQKIADTIDELNGFFEKKTKELYFNRARSLGSSDPWLGIPINWSQISSAKVIIESGLENFRIDPSQGTHFFQNMTSFKVGYLTINPFMDDGYFDVEYLNKQKVVFEDENIRHVRFKKPLTIIIDGKNNKGVIYKDGFVLKDKEDVEVEVSPLSRFE